MHQQLILGDFVFSITNKTAYEQLIRKSSGGWVNIDVLDNKPTNHNTGQGLESITISGQYFGSDGMKSLAKLRGIQSTRAPQTLVDGYGRNFGRWKIMEITENQSRVIDDGTALVIGFSIELEEFLDAAN